MLNEPLACLSALLSELKKSSATGMIIYLFFNHSVRRNREMKDRMLFLPVVRLAYQKVRFFFSSPLINFSK